MTEQSNTEKTEKSSKIQMLKNATFQTSCSIVFGVGVNDADYSVREGLYENGRLVYSWVCPFYQTWLNMLSRCYSARMQERSPTYRGCEVCDKWLTFSNFKAGMELQDWVGNELDKDLFGDGKLYSPETCCFISKNMNLLISSYRRGVGVSFHKKTQKWRAYYYHPVCKKQVHLGMYKDKDEAVMVAKEARAKSYEDVVLKQMDDPAYIKERFLLCM